MKKYIIAVLAAVCVACLCAVAACSNNVEEPNYYLLSYVQTNGVTIHCDIASGMEVKEGYTVTFTVTLSEDCEGEPAVYANSTQLEEVEGVYSFVMREETKITVTGVYVPGVYSLLFDKGTDHRIEYYDEAGNAVEDAYEVDAGESFRFSVQISVYYVNSFEVCANTEILSPDEDGLYTCTVTENVNIALTGLTEDLGFIAREDGGSGTADDPFKIERPMDLYYMAALINTDWYGGRYSVCYYKLMNDIDMKGEQLYIIGDLSTGDTGYARFCGTFDGNGHTISNYTINPVWIDQTEFTEVFLQYSGLFGFAQFAEIFDLHLENFTIEVPAAKYGSAFSTGGIVGYGVGVNITGCMVSGKISAEATDSLGYYGYVGGIVGIQSSYFDSTNLNYYYSSVRSCSADVEVEGKAGDIYAAGGITGYLVPYESLDVAVDSLSPAYVLNCYSTGDVYGAVHTGGIVGCLGSHGSVINCYSTGDVEAYNRTAYVAGYDDSEALRANAGGIVGYADDDSLVYGCFSTGETYASAAAGSKFNSTGAICGRLNAGLNPYIDSGAALEVNCAAQNATVDDDYLKNTLHWDEGDWVFTGNGRPTVNFSADAAKSFTVTLDYDGNAVDGELSSAFGIENVYAPVSYWYIVYDGQGIPEIIRSDNGLRSYGYFFDADHTQKVPVGFVPTHDLTLYAAFADYSEVAGEYYLALADNNAAYLTLEEDGTLVFRNGACNLTTSYLYDGESVMLGHTCLSLLSGVEISDSTINSTYPSKDYYFPYKGEIVNGGLSIYDLYWFASPVTALKKVEGFGYGSYYDEHNLVYTFYENGTGTISDGRTFTYNPVVSGDFTVTIDNLPRICRLTETGMTFGPIELTRHDAYLGTWEKSAGSHRVYTFDGKGGWTYEYYGYTAKENVNGETVGEKILIESGSGTYEVNADGSITLSDRNGVIGAVAKNGSGFLDVTVGGYTEEYYAEGSYVGTWKFNNVSEPVEITFRGLNAAGVGSATVTYSQTSEILDATYEILYGNSGKTYLALYYSDIQFGLLAYSEVRFTLEGMIYSMKDGTVRSDAVFFLTDDYYGTWVSENDVLSLVEFNGYGNYNLKGASHMPAIGYVSIGGVVVGTYRLENATLDGRFVYNGVTYKLSYDEATDCIEVSIGTEEEEGFAQTGEATLKRRDEWYDLQLESSDGATYSFDGRGKLASGGAMTCKLASGAEQIYTYFVNDGNIAFYEGGERIGTIVPDYEKDVYVLTTADGQEWLKLSNPFTGRWILAGGDGSDELVIGEIGSNFVTTGSYLGTEVSFAYDPENRTLSFEYGYTVTYVNSLGGELAVGTTLNLYVGSYTVCVRDADLDAWRGSFAGSDHSEITFDGLGNSVYGKGCATVVDQSGDERTVYAYTIYNGLPLLTVGGVKYLFVERTAEEGEIAYTVDDKTYVITALDDMFGISVKDAEGKLYEFDGLGSLTLDGTQGTYTVDKKVASLSHVVLTVTVGDAAYRVVYVYKSNGKTVLPIDDLYRVALVDADDATVSYTFDGMGTAVCSDGLTYSYTVTKKGEGSYTLILTDAAGNEISASVDLAEGTITIAE